MLPFWLPPLRRASLIHINKRKSKRASPTTDPITIPAMAPPERPLLPELAATGVGELVPVALAVGVLKVIVVVMVGKTTPAHRSVMSEL